MSADEVEYVRTKSSIPDGCVHIYTGKKVGISISRSYLEQLKQLGMQKWKRKPDMKYDHPDMDAGVGIDDNEMLVSIYRDEIGMETKLHNFMLIEIPKDVQDRLREMFPAKTRLRGVEWNLLGGRDPRVLHIFFDLSTAENLGQVDARSLFQ